MTREEATKFSGIQFRWLLVPSNSSHCSSFQIFLFIFSHFNNILELVQGATYLLNMSPWEHLSWQRYNEDIGPPRQGTNIWFIMVSWISIHQIIKYVSRCIHTPCSRRRATTFQKEEKRITSSEEEVTVMTRTTMAPVTSLSSQTTLFPPSLQGRRQEKRQLMKYNISLILFDIMSLSTKSSRWKTGKETTDEIWYIFNII